MQTNLQGPAVIVSLVLFLLAVITFIISVFFGVDLSRLFL